MANDVRPTRRPYGKAETLSRPQLEALQFRKLKRLLERSWEHNPFYRDLWQKAKVSPGDIRTLEDFRNRVPFVEKQDCLEDQADVAPLGRRLGVPTEKVAQIHLTSGTSGVGQEAWGLTQADVELSATLWIHQYRWMGLQRGDIAFYSMPVAFFANGLSAEHAARKMGLVAFNLFGMDKELVSRLMERFQPHYVYGTMTIPTMGGSDDDKPRERLHRLKGLSGALMSVDSMQGVGEAWARPSTRCTGAPRRPPSSARPARGAVWSTAVPGWSISSKVTSLSSASTVRRENRPVPARTVRSS